MLMEIRRMILTDSRSEDESDEGPTVQEVYDSMTDEQKDVVHYMVGAALEVQEEDDRLDEEASQPKKMANAVDEESTVRTCPY